MYSEMKIYTTVTTPVTTLAKTTTLVITRRDYGHGSYCNVYHCDYCYDHHFDHLWRRYKRSQRQTTSIYDCESGGLVRRDGSSIPSS